ncbi:efflux RND transporter permease subunit [Rhodohalobacter mucosus]|uniref:AcrB/AcrD/AcrF family protein n=1 Tax=Rhodohalobacter mucosus TaxID=2079485 RepID=A0A316TYD2_9BACT|nr:efflux RND transporter permease subunit [Rhodohalobacter mucosus]PWN07754.1 AcrB/AcrD/AcrF family protein [Rhodohalobacter mucosus]
MKKISITEKILKRPVTAIMMSLLVIGFGIFSLLNLKVTLYPSFNIPVMAVSVNYSNVAPDDMLQLVVEPIEAVVMGVEGVESLDSIVRQGGAFMILRLQPGTDIMITEQRVREAVERIRPTLPAEANEPFIFQFDPDRAPIMRLSVESDVLGLDELRQLSIEFIEPRFERIPGVASAETRGGLTRNIYVDLIPEAMSLHSILPNQVTGAIQSNNVQQPIGNLVADRTSYSIRAASMYSDVDQIAQTIISMTDGVPVRVSDVAVVRDDYEDIDNIVEINGRNSVTIEVQKQSDANTLEVAQSVIATVQEFYPTLPSNVTMQVLSNEGKFIEDSVSNLSQSALIALIVVILILLLFMGGWRIAFVVAMSIPVSLTATFAFMYFMDITLNIISITGLALAIGLLVDNSIVVSESIAKKLEEGQNRFKAALTGTNEVGGALLGSTLTTLAVFVPLMGLSGFQGTIARDLALTISISITSSFLASIILIPVLASLVMKREEFLKANYTFRWIRSLEENYISILQWILKRKYVVSIAILLIIGGSVYMFQNIQKEFFPETDAGQFDLRIELPAGTKLATTAEALRTYTDQILEYSEVQTVITNIGRRGRSTISNGGTLSITLVDPGQRDIETADIAAELQELLREPDVNVDISNLGGGGGIPFGRGGWSGRGIRVSLIGPDVEVLQRLTLEMEEKLIDDPMVMSVSNPRSRPTPELVYQLDRQRISRTGFTTQDVARELGAQARGNRAGFFREEGREIPIQVRNVREQFQNREDLYDLELLQVGEQRIPVLGLGEFVAQEGLSSINRRDRQTLLDVSIMVRGDLEEYQQRIVDVLENEIILPDGYRYEFSGSIFSQQESSAEVLISLLLALLLTYMVMASVFENFRDPFIVMFSVPLAFFGSLVFLNITGTPLSIPAYIGIVILIGIVVNNGIVLLDYIHQKTKNREESTDYLELFLEACQRRMRPILLTAMTTIFSMIPLALEVGSGSETWSPLARSVIGGLAFAAVLTLFVIPTVVVGISNRRRKVIKEAFENKSS